MRARRVVGTCVGDWGEDPEQHGNSRLLGVGFWGEGWRRVCRVEADDVSPLAGGAGWGKEEKMGLGDDSQ